MNKSTEEEMQHGSAGSPAVSVILPTYNRSKLLREAIDSVLAQEFTDWELLVIDDGSTDDTPAVLAAYGHDPRVRYLRQSNRGQSVARNLGLKHATGRWIAFIDSDDRWLPSKLQLQIDAVREHGDIDVVHSDIARIDLEGRLIGKESSRQKFSGEVWRPLLENNFVSMCTTLVRTARLREIGGFREDLRQAEDYDLWLRLATLCNFYYLPVTVSEYRSEGRRVSDDHLGCAAVNHRLVDDFLQRNPGLRSTVDAKRIHAKLHSCTARELAADGCVLAGLREAARGIRLSPGSVTTWRTLAAVGLHPVRARFARKG